MSNPNNRGAGPNVDIYPEEGGEFWLRVDRHSSGDWMWTIRTASGHPLGAEVARLNAFVMAKMGRQYAMKMIDKLNAPDAKGVTHD